MNCNGKILSLEKPVVMGILNITADSFYDGGKFSSDKSALEQVSKMLEEGASIIDIGASSSKPGSVAIDEKEEIQKIENILKLLVKEFPTSIFSVDTFRASVAETALANGAGIINDISGGEMDARMFPFIAKEKVPYIMMHMQNTPKTMQDAPQYKNVVSEVFEYFEQRLNQLKSLGASDIIIDLGFGFGKTMEHNYSLLKNLSLFKKFELPILAGLSRKSMINKALNISPNQALNGTTVLNTLALLNGANILRVHDVKEAMEAIKLVEYYNLPS